MKETIKGSFFDGKEIFENVMVVIDDGIVASIEKDREECNSNCFIMPCMIDAHTHMCNISQANKMLSYGINATFDVSAPLSLINYSLDFNIISSLYMAMGVVLSPKKYVSSCIEKGAKYIKVILFNSFSIGKKALKGIVEEAHKRNLKVVAHATEIKTYKQAVDCGVDVIIHLPMKDEITDEFARLIASKGIYVVPTLVMMETFAKSGRQGYSLNHFKNALKQVETLYKNGVQILVGTDANIGSFAPEVTYGDSLYYEIELLLKAKIPLIDVLRGATSKIGDAFGIPGIGEIKVCNLANMIVFNIVNENISISYNNLKNIWINGRRIK